MGKGKLYVVGIGPGDREYMAFKAVDVIKKSDVIIGYKLYIDILGNLLDGKEILSSGMRREVDRCQRALEVASKGKIVSIVSSGDAGIYGMAGVILQLADEMDVDVDIEIVPGITAANAVASSLGAPLMHDFAVISLSDLLTPWELIEKRLNMTGEGDFVVVLYNPKSHGRTEQIRRAREILLKYRSSHTPVGIVRNAKRGEETKVVTTLDKMLNHEMDMTTTVIIGNSHTYISDNRMITPRGYEI